MRRIVCLARKKSSYIGNLSIFPWLHEVGNSWHRQETDSITVRFTEEKNFSTIASVERFRVANVKTNTIFHGKIVHFELF
jgi:hypothetical protein